MRKVYEIAENDPDLDAFERLIVDFHPWYRRFKKKEGRPSYKHKNFYYRAFEQGPYPGIDDPYCPFAFTFFNKDHLYNYILQCHKFLEIPYGRKQDKGIGKVEDSFEELVKKTDSKLIRQLSLLVEESCAIWTDLIREYVIHRDDAYIDSDLQSWIIDKCGKISNKLMDISKSEELEFGELKTLDAHGRYGILAKVLLQEYKKILPSRIKIFTVLWVTELNDKKLKAAEEHKKTIKRTPFKKRKLPQYIDVVLAHHLVKQLSTRPEMPSSPCDFIYKEIHKNKFAKSRDLRALYRWLFIKAWLYSYLKKYSLTLSEVAEQISNDDDFFYMSDMPKVADFTNESDKEDIQQARFLDLKNNLSAWANNKSDQGYIYSQILFNSKDQA
ncbi:hypothetical protein L4D77_17890 [Photobacterium frigidiphilum]|uniref:hypothetical protein n=1 Tax=Photobacterium frigidiphilum TaxID=264736 RepID=UPI003D0AAF85